MSNEYEKITKIGTCSSSLQGIVFNLEEEREKNAISDSEMKERERTRCDICDFRLAIRIELKTGYILIKDMRLERVASLICAKPRTYAFRSRLLTSYACLTGRRNLLLSKLILQFSASLGEHSHHDSVRLRVRNCGSVS